MKYLECVSVIGVTQARSGSLRLLLRVATVLAVLFTVVYAQDEISLEQAENIAIYECQRMYGDYALFSKMTYYDSDESPSVYVFVFQRDNEFRNEVHLIEHMRAKSMSYSPDVRLLRTAKADSDIDTC